MEGFVSCDKMALEGLTGEETSVTEARVEVNLVEIVI